MNILSFHSGVLGTGPINETIIAARDGMLNFYILKGPEGLICIDAGWRKSCVSRIFESLGLYARDVAAVLLTHRHWDHARCVSLFSTAEVFSNAGTDQTISVAGFKIRAIPTPGHSSESVSYLTENHALFTGDTLRLKHGKVRPFFPCLNQNTKLIRQSIHQLAEIQGLKLLLTSHSGISRDPENAFSEWRIASNTTAK